ncbi:MAG: hypothetical protein K0Q47_1428 [Sedimentibacter sp.]|nr:hypothetical protein [Sedimentibacter sp.]
MKGITQSGNTVNIEMNSGTDLSQELIGYLIENYNAKIKFDVSKVPMIKYKLDSSEQMKILEELEKFFELLNNYKTGLNACQGGKNEQI